ncbi:PQQ-binding-like beta-propeller repeat protein [Pirellulales bacterium]|nr:PQQ-binding-like beta-propeller repeat protein [Pirellulales bacterium]
MNTEDFLDILQQRKLVPDNIVAQLRAKAKQSDKRITAKSVLKYLVKKELLTPRQAKELLATTLTVNEKAESSILGSIPLPEQPSERVIQPVEPMISQDPEPEAAVVESTPEPSAEPAAEPAAESAAEPAEESGEESGAASAPLAALESPLGGLLDEALAAEGGGGPLDDSLVSADAPDRKRRKKKRKQGKKNEWDSPLLLLGGAALVLLLVGGGAIYYLLIRENSDAVLKEASDFFAGGSLTQAERSYQHFVDSWPGHPEYSHAKVRLGMTRIWIAVDRGDFAAALATAKSALDDIEDEEAFEEDRESKAELSSLLTNIAEGLAEEAQSSSDPAEIKQRLEQTLEVIGLTANTKYVPASLILKDRLAPVRETIERVERQQQRNVDLAATIAAIEAAIADRDPARGYEARKQLLKQYPALSDDESLAAKVLEVAAVEQSAVKFVEMEQAAESGPRDGPIASSVLLADSSGGNGADAGWAVIRVDGALYGIDVKTGSVGWRHFAGYAPTAWPLVTADRVFATTGQGGEIFCLESATGKVVWRQTVEDRLAAPVALDEQLLVAGMSGKLYVVSQQDGALRGAVEFSQPLPTPPAVSARNSRIYLTGEHSSLYALNSDDFSCIGAHYLGHASQSISVPPAVVSNKLVVAHNSGAETSSLTVLSLDKNGVPTSVATQRRLEGLVTTPLATQARRIAAVTSQGQASVFEVGSGDGESAMVDIASRSGKSGPPVARFAWMDRKHLWMGGEELTKFAVLPSGNRLPVRSLDSDYSGGVIDQPLQAFGQTLVYAQRLDGEAGSVAGGIDMGRGKRQWETRIAAPLAGSPAVNSTTMVLTAADARGAVYALQQRAIQQGNAAKPSARAGGDFAPLTTSVDLGSGRLAAGAPGMPRLLHFNPDAPRSPARTIELPGSLAGSLVAWGDRFVAPAVVGQVLIFDSTSGMPAAAPFQPDVRPNQTFPWLTPATSGSPGNGALFIANPAGKLYRVELVNEPQAHLVAVASVDVDGSGLTTRLAIVGDKVVAGDSQGRLWLFSTESLESDSPTDLGGPITWGPFAAGDVVLVAVDGKEFVAVDADGQEAWRQSLEHGPPVGKPLVDGTAALLAYRLGGIGRTVLTDGRETTYAPLYEPLGSGIAAYGSQLAVASADGAVLFVELP